MDIETVDQKMKDEIERGDIPSEEEMIEHYRYIMKQRLKKRIIMNEQYID